MISLDTETTGLDLQHGCRPFLVTTCNEAGQNVWWEWDVDPRSRRVQASPGDLEEIQFQITKARSIALHNAKFDYTALSLLFEDHGMELRWDWSKVHDSLLAGHLLASNQPHSLAVMSLVYLRRNIKPLEDKLHQIVKEATTLAKLKYPSWRIASNSKEVLPSAKGKLWSNDYWLPRAVAIEQGRHDDDEWLTVLAEYANGDSSATLLLCKRVLEEIDRRKLMKIYRERLKVLPIICGMQSRGVTVSRPRLESLQEEYRDESTRLGKVCTGIAERAHQYRLTLPKSGNNHSLMKFVFGETCPDCEGEGFYRVSAHVSASCPSCMGKGRKGNLNLTPLQYSKKTGAPALDKGVLEHFEATLPARSLSAAFVRSLRAKRRLDTSLSYIESYQRFWLPALDDDWFLLHPSLNPTGAATLRWSSQNPNEQNISKQRVGGHSLRSAFGPAPGREWWSLDAKNIELRIPAYVAGEKEMIALFERPDDPPYYGSYHLLVFDTLHPKMFARYGTKCKERFASTWYQWTKNGNFAVQYGAVEQSGTADRAYHVPGAQGRIQGRFSRIAKLNKEKIALAEKQGYIETIPDKTIDPERGYPLLCTRSNWGKILPTVPLNYYVSGTAMWWMMKAMIRVDKYLDSHNRTRKDRARAYMVMQVHDELVFDFPRSATDPSKPQEGFNKLRNNLGYIKEVRKLMELGGEDIGVPTPVSVTYHPNNWGEGVTIS